MNCGYIIDQRQELLVSSDSLEHCFRDFMKYITKQGYTVCLCNRLARCSAQHGGWKEEYIIFNNGKSLSQLADKIEHGQYTAAIDDPVIEHKDSLTDEIIVQWSKPYLGRDADDYERSVWVEKDNHTFLFVLSTIYPRCAISLTIEEAKEWEKNLDSSFILARLTPFSV